MRMASECAARDLPAAIDAKAAMLPHAKEAGRGIRIGLVRILLHSDPSFDNRGAENAESIPKRYLSARNCPMPAAARLAMRAQGWGRGSGKKATFGTMAALSPGLPIRTGLARCLSRR
jgi:hypothetical protein